MSYRLTETDEQFLKIAHISVESQDRPPFWEGEPVTEQPIRGKRKCVCGGCLDKEATMTELRVWVKNLEARNRTQRERMVTIMVFGGIFIAACVFELWWFS